MGQRGPRGRKITSKRLYCPICERRTDPMNETKTFRIHSIDNGFCRVNYVAKNAQGHLVYYCLQDEGANYGGVVCYRCCKEFEPSYRMDYQRKLFEVPTGDSSIESIVREYLTKEGSCLTFRMPLVYI